MNIPFLLFTFHFLWFKCNISLKFKAEKSRGFLSFSALIFDTQLIYCVHEWCCILVFGNMVVNSLSVIFQTFSCKAYKVSAGVHDSFWTHAADVDQMNQILRETFVELYKQPILENVSFNCMPI